MFPVIFFSGFLLFFIGIIQCMTAKQFLAYLFGIEIIISGGTINLVGFLFLQPSRVDIEPLIILIIGFAAIETVAGLVIFTWSSKQLKIVGSPLEV
jgi:NADH:ubiquinone oxidoreductase subunit K